MRLGNGKPKMKTGRMLAELSLAVAIVLLGSLSEAAADDTEAQLLQDVQGTWVRHVRTAQGRVTIAKEHSGTNTTLVAYDAQNQVLYAHKSQFKVEKSGQVCVLTFFHRTITAGPHAGKAINGSASFAYRIANNQFIEVRGILENDPEAPSMVIWDRKIAQEQPAADIQ